jgi:Concanavalin A-like lectin/glucanases superfamily
MKVKSLFAVYLLLVTVIFANMTTSCTKDEIIIKDTVTVRDTIIKVIKDTVTVKDTINFADTTALKKGLVAWYPFRGNTNDMSGNGLNGSLYGNAKLSIDERGQANSAIELDGFGDAMIVQPSPKFNLGNEATFAFKFMSRADNQRQNYLALEEFTTGQGTMFGVGTTLPGSAQFLNTGVIIPGVYTCGTYPVPSDGASLISTFNPVENIWYHFTLVYTTTSYKVYINGNKIGEVATNGNPFPYCSTANLLIGSWWVSDMISLNGKMDDIRVYNRALSEKELFDLFKTSLYLRKG